MIYRTKCATNQMPCTTSVQDSQNPTDTPGSSKPDETRPRKSYLAALTSEAARTSPAGPLGFDNTNWPPLASMAIDPPPKLFVRPKDRVPPDRISPPPPIKRRRRRRRHHQRRNNQPNAPSPIKSDTDLVASLSSIIDHIQSQALDHLRTYFRDELSTIQRHITTSLKQALHKAVTRLRTKLRAEISSSHRPPNLQRRTRRQHRVPRSDKKSHALHRDDRRVPETEDAGNDSRNGSVCSGDEVNCCLLSDDGYSSSEMGNHGGGYVSPLFGPHDDGNACDDQVDCCDGNSDGNSLSQESGGGWSDS